jgi:hypothetical protein
MSTQTYRHYPPTLLELDSEEEACDGHEHIVGPDGGIQTHHLIHQTYGAVNDAMVQLKMHLQENNSKMNGVQFSLY